MSTQLPETFDTSQEEGNSWGLIPVGEYVAQVIETSVAPPKSGNGYMLTLVWKILEGEYENRQLWQMITYLHPNEVAQTIGRKTIRDLCNATGVDGAVRDAEIFLYKPARIRVGVEKDKNGIYEDKNRVSRIAPLKAKESGTGAQALNSSPSKGAPAAVAAAATKAGPAGTAPWHRNAGR
jgi:hypothetical protein